ncbi:MAG TPA: FtsX-like permease family protein [Streptosporangiaceae bacterium]|jgi:putative ABC transport system permease protein
MSARGGLARVRRAWMQIAGTGVATCLSLALLVLASAFVCVAAARGSQSVGSQALRSALAKLTPYDKTVVGSTSYDGLFRPSMPGTVEALDGITGTLRQNLSRAHLPLAPGGADWSGLSTSYFVVTAGGHGAYDGFMKPQAQLAYRSDLSAHARLLSGHLPGVGQRAQGKHGPVFQVAVTAATASRFGLRAGSQMTLQANPQNPLAAGTVLDVTGIVRPLQPGSAFWSVDANLAAPDQNPSHDGVPIWLGAALISSRELPLLDATQTAPMQLNWGFPLTVAQLTTVQGSALLQDLSPASMASLGVIGQDPPQQIQLNAGLGGVLAGFAGESAAVAGVLGLLVVSLAAIGLVVVLLGALLLADQRRGEFALMRARGAGSWQLAALALRATALIAIPAAVIGTAAAILVTPGASGEQPWLLAGLTLGTALLGFPAIVVFRQRRASRVGSGRAPGARRTLIRGSGARRLTAELTAIAVAAAGLVVGRQQGVPAAGTDLLASSAPVLVAIPAAILAMRACPLFAQWLLRLASRRRGVVAYVGLARAARTSQTAVLPVFALVLVLGMVAFGGMVHAAVSRGEIDASWQQVGADASINAQNASPGLTPATLRAINAVPGVQHAAAVTVTTGIQVNGSQFTVVIVNPRQYAAMAATAHGPAFPAGALARTTRSDAADLGLGKRLIPALATHSAIAALGDTTDSIAIGNIGQQIGIRVAGPVSLGPGIANGGATPGGVVVLPRWALRQAPAPDLMLITGAHLDSARLLAVTRRLLPGAKVALRAQVAATLASSPLTHATYVAYAVGAAAAAGFGLLVLLITLLADAAARKRTLARMAAMGLSPAQGRWLLMAETLPEIVLAVLAGSACAWALALIVGPDLNLAPFTGSAAGVPVRPEPVVLAATAAGLLVVAMATLTGQALVAGRRGVARALRIGD